MVNTGGFALTSPPEAGEEAFGSPSNVGWLGHAGNGAITALMIALTVCAGLVVGVLAVVKPELAIALLPAVAYGLATLRRPSWATVVVVALVPILSGIRRGFPVPGLRLTEVLGTATALAVLVTMRRVGAVAWTRVEVGLLIYVIAYAGLGAYDAHALGVHSSLSDYGTLLGPLQFFLIFRTVRFGLRSARRRRQALRCYVFASVPVCVLAVLQQVNAPGIRSFVANITDSAALQNGASSGYSSFARATGPFPHWTPLAGYLVVVIVVLLSLLFTSATDVASPRTLFAVLVVNALALLLTAELSAVAGLAVGAVALAAWYRKLGLLAKWAAVCAAVLAVLAGPLLVSRLRSEYHKEPGFQSSAAVPQTVGFRFQIWEHQYIPAIEERPIDGYGLLQPPSVSWPDTESQYITLFMRGGALLAAAYVGLMIATGTGAMGVAKMRGDPERVALARSLFIIVAILQPINIVFPYFEDSGLPQALWVLAGLCFAMVPGRLPTPGTMDALDLATETGQTGHLTQVRT